MMDVEADTAEDLVAKEEEGRISVKQCDEPSSLSLCLVLTMNAFN